ncbi:TetR/AcrR family transcriptional regulator [Gordonia sp. X0973]|uniref:TetR/AcrR family transcriptional regulator n=1 Tax=Gordonia sp. X0973 TaxID=2742602 RepID=UPI000F5210F9|nr:TetR/AcrR family transcriptional regulator [Gordonia sp. X0973]QKT07797.1 TetR/AcrR family transcriptional regulator [Gordonia sp. X0973]
MAAADRGYDGIPAAQRRAARREALLEATLDLISESGAAAVSKRSVCARARLNDRYFYEHFADRDVLLSVLGQELTAEALRAVIGSMLLVGGTAEDRVRAAVDAALDYFTEDSRRGRLVLESGSDRVLQQEWLSGIRTVADAAVGIAPLLIGEHRPADEDLSVTAYILVSGSVDLLAAWLRGDVAISRATLVDRIVDLTSAALDRASQADGAGQVDATRAD